MSTPAKALGLTHIVICDRCDRWGKHTPADCLRENCPKCGEPMLLCRHCVEAGRIERQCIACCNADLPPWPTAGQN